MTKNVLNIFLLKLLLSPNDLAVGRPHPVIFPTCHSPVLLRASVCICCSICHRGGLSERGCIPLLSSFSFQVWYWGGVGGGTVPNCEGRSSGEEKSRGCKTEPSEQRRCEMLQNIAQIEKKSNSFFRQRAEILHFCYLKLWRRCRRRAWAQYLPTFRQKKNSIPTVRASPNKQPQFLSSRQSGGSIGLATKKTIFKKNT